MPAEWKVTSLWRLFRRPQTHKRHPPANAGAASDFPQGRIDISR
jgi:hypothetical protein